MDSEKKMDLVSILMSVNNSSDTIERSVESILNQDYKKIEFLIIDDGSTDDTYEKLLELSKKNKNITLFRNEENIGLTKSLNVLIKNSNGKILGRQDGDDISLPNRISTQYNYLKHFNLDFCTSRAFKNDTNKKIPGYSFFISPKILMKYKNPFIHGTLLIKKSIMEDIGLYDENFYYAQDYKLMKDLIKKNYKFKTINECLYFLNMKNNISTLKKDEQKYYSECVRKNIVPSV